MGSIIFSLVITIISYFVVFSSNAFAAFTVSNIPSSINSDQEIEVNVELSLQGQANKKYYLEGALKKDDGQNYFGLTFNDSEWVSYTASNFTTLKPITTDSAGSFIGNLKFKIDTSSSYYKGNGTYIFQLKRFTEAGSSSWSDNSSTMEVLDVQPSATPSPFPSPTSSPSPSTEPIGTTTKPDFIISPDKVNFYSAESLIISIQLSGLEAGSNYYLKPALIKGGSSNYFGLTKVNGSWTKNTQSYSEQYTITTDSSGSWSGNIEFKVDPDDSGFTGSGSYILKTGRYSATGSGPTWSNEVTVDIIDNTPKATSTPASSSTTPSSTPQASILGSTTKSSLPKSLTTQKSTGHSLAGSEDNFKLPNLSSILGASVAASEKNPSVLVRGQNNLLQITLGIGLILVSIAAVFYYFRIKKGYKIEKINLEERKEDKKNDL
jgi:hypothetical protein